MSDVMAQVRAVWTKLSDEQKQALFEEDEKRKAFEKQIEDADVPIVELAKVFGVKGFDTGKADAVALGEAIEGLVLAWKPKAPSQANATAAKKDPVEETTLKILREGFRKQEGIVSTGRFSNDNETKFAEYAKKNRADAAKQAPAKLKADKKAAYEAAKKSKANAATNK